MRVLLVIVAAVVLQAQAATGTIAGKVVDSQGSVLPGVAITATKGNERRTTTTNVRGEYLLEQLPPGSYRVTATLGGFAPDVVELVVEAGHVVEQAAVLKMAPPKDHMAELRAFARPYIGAEPADCGQHLLQGRGSEPVSVERLQASVACGLQAASAKRVFWLLNQNPGLDSKLFEGLLGTADGTIYLFSYDSDPCGGAGCMGRFLAKICQNPSVLPDRERGTWLRCAR